MNAPELHIPEIPRRTLREIALMLALVAVSFVALLVAGARYGVLLPQARFLIEAGADGLKVGRMGRLKIEGLSGDIWRDVTVQKLTIRDEGGVWLEANNVHMTWRYEQLLRRNFRATSISADTIRLLRRPTLTEKGKDTGLPVSFHIDRAHARVVMEPAFSYERGVYDLDLNLDLERSGDQRGVVRAISVLHPGDHLNLDYDLAAARPLLVRVDGVEARGGALAGALGLPPNQAFALQVQATGKASAGQFTAIANSGPTQPLKAQGAWAKDGGDARGVISLTASTLTTPYAARFGPKASFVLAGRRAGPDLFALDGRVSSENFSLRAQGLGHVGDRRIGPQGIDVTAETAALSRITGGSELGPARIVGKLSEGKPRLAVFRIDRRLACGAGRLWAGSGQRAAGGHGEGRAVGV